MKKGKGVAVGASPGPGFLYPVVDEAKTRRRYEILLEDCQDLLKENEAKRKELVKAKQKKLRLLAEVKFLRKKYESLSKNPSGKKTCRLKKRTQNETIQFFLAGQTSNSLPVSEVPANNHTPPTRESAFASTSTVIDLNQVSFPTDEDMEEFQLKTDMNMSSTDGHTTANDLKFPIYRDVGSGANRVPKRKITWQDQVALKV